MCIVCGLYIPQCCFVLLLILFLVSFPLQLRYRVSVYITKANRWKSSRKLWICSLFLLVWLLPDKPMLIPLPLKPFTTINWNVVIDFTSFNVLFYGHTQSKRVRLISLFNNSSLHRRTHTHEMPCYSTHKYYDNMYISLEAERMNSNYKDFVTIILLLCLLLIATLALFFFIFFFQSSWHTMHKQFYHCKRMWRV